MPTAAIIGSGPNGLSAAITLASAGVAVTVSERNARIGGGCSTAEITLPGFRHDLGSSVYPMGVASPFFCSLPLEIPWIEPAAPCAHPLDDGTAVLLEHSIEETVTNLDTEDGRKYRSLLEPLADRFADLATELLGPFRTSRSIQFSLPASVFRRFCLVRRSHVRASPAYAHELSSQGWPLIR